MKKYFFLSVIFVADMFLQSGFAQNDTLAKPVLFSASAISYDRFTAHWNSVPSANSYLLAVWTADTVRETNKPISSTSFSSPNNWILNCSTSSQNYWILSLGNNNITSPAIDFSGYADSVELTVEARTFGSISNNSADISIYVNTVKVAAIQFTSTNTNPTYYTVTIPVSGIAVIQLIAENSPSTSRGAGIKSVSLTGNYTEITRSPVPNAPFSTADTFYTVAGLQDSTLYYYCVTAINDTLTSTSNEDFITTFPMPVIPKPVLYETTDVQFDRFTAHWSNVSEATNYLLAVWSADTIQETNKLISSTSFSSPNDWIINNSGASTDYWRFFKSSGITSPTIDFSGYANIELTIYARTYGTVSGTSADISIYVNTIKVAAITPDSNGLKQYSVPIYVTGIATIQLKSESTYTGSGVGIAEVNLTGFYTEIIRYPVLNAPFSTTDTFYTVTGLQDATAYIYTVTATCDVLKSISEEGCTTTLSLPTYIISASCSEHGSISPDENSTVKHGGSIYYTFLPDADCYVDSVFIDGMYDAESSVNQSYTFDDVMDNHTIYVKFDRNTTSIRNQRTNSGLKIYHNHNTVSIVNEDTVSIQSIRILDMSGRIVYQHNTSIPEITLALSKGIYFVQVITLDGEIFRCKFSE